MDCSLHDQSGARLRGLRLLRVAALIREVCLLGNLEISVVSLDCATRVTDSLECKTEIERPAGFPFVARKINRSPRRGFLLRLCEERKCYDITNKKKKK